MADMPSLVMGIFITILGSKALNTLASLIISSVLVDMTSALTGPFTISAIFFTCS